MEITYDAFISRLFDKATQTGTPLFGTFELTPRCTLDCKMCYIHNKANDRAVIEQEKPTEWWLDLAKAEQPKNIEKFEKGVEFLGLDHKYPMPKKWKNDI